MGLSPKGPPGAAVPVPGEPNTMHYVVDSQQVAPMPPWDLQFHDMILHRGDEADSHWPCKGGGIGLKALGRISKGLAEAAVPVPSGPNTMHFVV